MSLTRYPTYKDSGVEWLGDVPEHWQTTPLRGLACEERHAFIDGDWIEAPFITDEGIRLIQTGNIGVGYYKEQGFRYISFETFELLRCSEISPGDVLICRLAEPVGRACIAPDLDSRMITSVDVCILKPRTTVDPRFVVYTLSSAQYLGFMEGQCRGGTRDRVSRSFLGRVRVPVPAVSEQAKIADFLDIETAKIDALVEEQRKLIELLKEKRQAVISHAVTKGLNPDVPMKPSGIEWIGDVPAHWEVRRFQRCVYVSEGQVNPEDTAYAVMPLIAPNHIESGTGRLRELVSASEQGAESGKYLCKAGDVVYSKIRPALRKVCIAPVDCLCSADMYPLRAHSGLSSEFLFWSILSEQFSALAVVESQRVAMPKINRESLKSVVIAMPPREEQVNIAAFLELEAMRIDSLVAEAEIAIQLFDERRVALISAAVTGQIDVRELVVGAEA